MFNLKESQEKAFEAFAEGADRYVGEVEKTDGASVDTDILTSAVYNYHTDMSYAAVKYGDEMLSLGYENGYDIGRKDGEHHAFLVIAAVIVMGAAVISVAGSILDGISKRKKNMRKGN